jgi:hypothetical protein
MEATCSVERPTWGEANYRFELRRNWLIGSGTVNFVMLNPSTADDTNDDATIRKCVGFARRWGYEQIAVTNLFAFRATDPKKLQECISASYQIATGGEENDKAIARHARDAQLIVAAWGTFRTPRANFVLDILRRFNHVYCIGVTKENLPLHPCRPAYTERPVGYYSKR